MVAAIDFGTTYSSCAFSFRCDPQEVLTQTWKDPLSMQSSDKIPTTLLLGENGEFESFGYDAETTYANLVSDDEREKYYYFSRFKMLLFKEKEVCHANYLLF